MRKVLLISLLMRLRRMRQNLWLCVLLFCCVGKGAVTLLSEGEFTLLNPLRLWLSLILGGWNANFALSSVEIWMNMIEVWVDSILACLILCGEVDSIRSSMIRRLLRMNIIGKEGVLFSMLSMRFKEVRRIMRVNVVLERNLASHGLRPVLARVKVLIAIWESETLLPGDTLRIRVTGVRVLLLTSSRLAGQVLP